MFSTDEKSSKATTPDSGREWFSLEQMQNAFDVTPQGFAKSIRPLIPETDIRGEGKRNLLIHCRHTIDAYAAKKGEALARKADPLLTGANSPELERYRKLRADTVELELQRQRKTHVDISNLERVLNQYTTNLRRAGEVLQRKFGNEASEIFNEAVGQAEEVTIKEILSHGNGNHKS